MIDFCNLNRQELARNGILFESSEEAESFIDYIMEKLEIQIGEEISNRCTAQQLEEFDSITDPAEAARWLVENCPRYWNIVSERCLGFGIELMEELLEKRHEIVGVTMDERIIAEQLSNAKDDYGYLSFYSKNHLTEPLNEEIGEGFMYSDLTYEDLTDEEYYGDGDYLDEEYGDGEYIGDENCYEKTPQVMRSKIDVESEIN